MTLLLDTNVIIFGLNQPERLSGTILEMLRSAQGRRLIVSDVSRWEIAIKESIGKLRMPTDYLMRINAEPFQTLPIRQDHVLAVRDLPLVKGHGDPFDRLLICQARIEGLTIVTTDAAFEHYDVEIIRP